MSNNTIKFNKDGTANIIRTSPFTGKVNLMVMTLSQRQFEDWQEGGMLIQAAMPHLSASEREFIMTGITDDEWPSESDG